MIATDLAAVPLRPSGVCAMHTYIQKYFTFIHTYLVPYLRTCVHAYIRAYIHTTYIYVYIRISIYIYVYMYILCTVYIYICAYVSMYACVYIYIERERERAEVRAKNKSLSFLGPPALVKAAVQCFKSSKGFSLTSPLDIFCVYLHPQLHC